MKQMFRVGPTGGHYGGPHDYLNGVPWGGYETQNVPSALRFVGNAAVVSPWHYRFIEVMNILDVPLATPFVAGMALSDTGSQWLLYRPKTEERP